MIKILIIFGAIADTPNTLLGAFNASIALKTTCIGPSLTNLLRYDDWNMQYHQPEWIDPEAEGKTNNKLAMQKRDISRARRKRRSAQKKKSKRANRHKKR